MLSKHDVNPDDTSRKSMDLEYKAKNTKESSFYGS